MATNKKEASFCQIFLFKLPKINPCQPTKKRLAFIIKLLIIILSKNTWGAGLCRSCSYVHITISDQLFFDIGLSLVKNTFMQHCTLDGETWLILNNCQTCVLQSNLLSIFYLTYLNLTLAYLTLSYLTLSYLTLSYLTLSYLILLNLTLCLRMTV